MAGKHVLIVDDEPKVAFVLGRALEHSNKGYRITVAHSGEKALEILERSSVDLLVTDLRMPGISGLDLIRWVRTTSPKTRTILITAYGDDKVEAEARRLEAYRYITKPFNIADFTQAVEEALREVALARPGLLILSDECFEAVAERLETLRQEIGARCILLADVQGQRLVEVGDTQGLDTITLLALLAGGIAASMELARRLDDDHALNLNFHEGSRYDLYAATVGDGLFLAIICDREVQPSRIGLVWLYTRRAIEELRSMLLSTEAASPAPRLGEDFTTSLAAELDALLTERPDAMAAVNPPISIEGAEPDAPLIEKPCDNAPVALQEAKDESPLRASLEETRPPLEAGSEAIEEGRPPERELLDLETAIKRGIIPPDFLLSERA
ncbi:MAG TPA: response regulator [Thermoflexia bacterium]|jgi:CheY-like chemotaxis protein|nr:response regulator [Thermoflexia bacterium]